MKHFGVLSLVILFTCFSFSNPTTRIKQTREATDFTKISCSLGVTLHLKQGSFEVIVEANEDILGKIETKVDNNTLIIKKKDGNGNLNSNIDVYVTLPKLTNLSLAGSTQTFFENTFQFQNLDISSAGSCTLNFNSFSAEKLVLDLAGSCVVKIENAATCDNIEMQLAGSNNVFAKELAAKNATVDIGGSSKCELNVTEKLDVSIAGSGSVLYAGNPVINSQISGSGKITKM